MSVLPPRPPGLPASSSCLTSLLRLPFPGVMWDMDILSVENDRGWLQA